MDELRPHIRWMIRRDMPEVLQIETLCFDFPWREEDFLRNLQQRNVIGMVAEAGYDKILAFMMYELHKNKLHLIDFAVHPDFRLKGIGTALIEKLKSKLSSYRRKTITIWVRESNLPMQLFLREMEFKAEFVHRNFFKDSDEDGYYMRYLYLENLSVEF